MKNRFARIKTIYFQWLQLVGSDLLVPFWENFVKNEYQFISDNKHPLVVDCWSNIGDSVLYFKYLYPDAIMHCFEPDPVAFKVLKHNIEINKLKDVHTYNIALAKEKWEINFFVADSEEMSLTSSTFQNRVADHTTTIKVKTDSLSSIIGDKKIDMLKIDIEWGEDSVLEDLDEKGLLWNVKEMIIEYHHNFPDKTSWLAAFLDILEKNNFHYQITALHFPMFVKEAFQDILIHAYKL